MNTDRARHGSASSHQIKRALLGNVCVLALGIALAMGSSPAAAKSKVKHKSAHKETEHVSKDPFGDIPKGPLQIFISINQQKLHLYSDGTHVADALVATGVPGHSTPMGVFSVIEKDRYHHSNIYSNAPMPYMQRVTWSGVAMHEGPGVGHVASHGCIRMPHDFAARLWVLTKLGVRVIIARPELRPIEFADAHLFVHKQKPSAPAAALSGPVKTAQTIDTSKTSDAVDSPLLRGPADAPSTSDPTPAPLGAEATHASSGAQSTGATALPPKPAALDPVIEERKGVTVGNAPGLDDPPTPAANVAPASDGALASETEKLDPVRDAPKPEAPTTAEASEPAPAATAQAAESATPAEPANAALAESTAPSKLVEAAVAAFSAPADPAKPDVAESSSGPSKPVEPAVAASSAPAEPAKPDVAESSRAPSKPVEPAVAASSAPAEPAKPDVAESSSAPSMAAEPTPAEQPEAQKAPAPQADIAAPVTAAPQDVPMPLPKPAQLTRVAFGGPIAIFVSRKERKIYVRQNFARLFEAPVTIEHPEQPLGTHVFTAMDYLADGTTFRWNVVSLPGEQPKATRDPKYEKKSDKHGKGSRRGEAEARPIADPQPPETPQQALARVEIPQDVIDQISQLIVPGSSLVVSDQGLGPETGTGTDFIVVTR